MAYNGSDVERLSGKEAESAVRVRRKQTRLDWPRSPFQNDDDSAAGFDRMGSAEAATDTLISGKRPSSLFSWGETPVPPSPNNLRISSVLWNRSHWLKLFTHPEDPL